MKKDVFLNVDESMIDTVLADDIEFQGKMSFSKSLMIKGKFEGEIESSGHLIIGPGAISNAQIKAEVVTNYGEITGNVEGTEKIELFNEASLHGDIKTPELIIESGCVFNGKCEMKGTHKSKTENKTPPPQNNNQKKK